MIDLCACPEPALDRPGGDPRCRRCGRLAPLETDEVPTREATLLAAALLYPGRPVIVHRGSFSARHRLSTGGSCWCLPDVVIP